MSARWTRVETKRVKTMSTWLYVPASYSSEMRRASGRISSNDGRRRSREVGDDRDPSPAHRVAALAADADQLQVPLVLHDFLGDEADHVGVERSGQAPIARDQDHEPLALFAPAQERMLVAAEHGRKVSQDLVEELRVRARGQSRLLGAPQLRRRNELHRPGDLPDIPRRCDASPDVSLTGTLLLSATCPG